jgi:hypothetical protein
MYCVWKGEKSCPIYMLLYILIDLLRTQSIDPPQITAQLIKGHDLEPVKSMFQPPQDDRECQNIREPHATFAHLLLCISD